MDPEYVTYWNRASDIMQETPWIEIGLAISTFLGAFILGGYRQYKKLTKRKNDIDWSVHTHIHEFLTELRVRTNASRSEILQFHNGEYFSDGVSMKKVSTTHESVSTGISSDAINGALLTLYLPMLEKLDHDRPLIIFTEEERPSFFKNTLDLANVYSYVVIPLRYSGSKNGLIMLQWCDDDGYTTDNSEHIQKELFYYRNIIETKLSNQLKPDKA